MTSGRVIAILEHDQVSSDALAMIVSDWGAKVVQGRSAEDVLEHLGPDLGPELSCVIADYDIPGHRDGVAASKHLQQTAPECRVLILGGNIHTRGDAAAAAAGYDIIHKPARAEDIIAWLNSEK
ncbi:MAG: response regulator [Caulobacterales bacterium]